MIKKIVSILILLPALVHACPEALRYGDPCIGHGVRDTYKKSVYSEDHVCTLPLLDDGVCPDYLNGGCAIKNTCSDGFDREIKHDKTVLFSDE